MNYKKIILVGVISAFVALLTSVMGVAGTIIGSVISSVLYNMLTEALEKPVNKATFKHDFEWDIAYVFPLVVIAIIQLLLIFALLAEIGILPGTFLNVYLSIQDFADNNLYRILGIALLVISAYPLVLKPEFVKKGHGVIIAGVGLVFLARGFVDLGNNITDIYDGLFIHFDLPIAIIAFVMLAFVIFRILILSRKSENEVRMIQHSNNQKSFNPDNVHRTHHSQKHGDFNYVGPRKSNEIRVKKHEAINKPKREANVNFKNHVVNQNPADEINDSTGINESSDRIHFESNDLLDDYRK